MHHAMKLLAALSLACASGASAAPIATPKPPEPKPGQTPGAPKPGDAPATCKPVGNVVFAIDHRAVPDAKLATATVKLFGDGAWTRVETTAEGQAQPATSGCLARQDAKHVASELRSAPWKVTTARVHCMAMSSTFTEFRVDGKLVFTQKLCSGQSLDDKSKAALDAAIAMVEPVAPPPAPPAAPKP
jgi:hypothetical protein